MVGRALECDACSLLFFSSRVDFDFTIAQRAVGWRGWLDELMGGLVGHQEVTSRRLFIHLFIDPSITPARCISFRLY